MSTSKEERNVIRFGTANLPRNFVSDQFLQKAKQVAEINDEDVASWHQGTIQNLVFYHVQKISGMNLLSDADFKDVGNNVQKEPLKLWFQSVVNFLEKSSLLKDIAEINNQVNQKKIDDLLPLKNLETRARRALQNQVEHNKGKIMNREDEIFAAETLLGGKKLNIPKNKDYYPIILNEICKKIQQSEESPKRRELKRKEITPTLQSDKVIQDIIKDGKEEAKKFLHQKRIEAAEREVLDKIPQGTDENITGTLKLKTDPYGTEETLFLANRKIEELQKIKPSIEKKSIGNLEVFVDSETKRIWVNRPFISGPSQQNIAPQLQKGTTKLNEKSFTELKNLMSKPEYKDYAMYLSVLTYSGQSGHYQLVGVVPTNNNNGSHQLHYINSLEIKPNSGEPLLTNIQRGLNINVTEKEGFEPIAQMDDVACGSAHSSIVGEVLFNSDKDYKNNLLNKENNPYKTAHYGRLRDALLLVENQEWNNRFIKESDPFIYLELDNDQRVVPTMEQAKTILENSNFLENYVKKALLQKTDEYNDFSLLKENGEEKSTRIKQEHAENKEDGKFSIFNLENMNPEKEPTSSPITLSKNSEEPSLEPIQKPQNEHINSNDTLDKTISSLQNILAEKLPEVLKKQLIGTQLLTEEEHLLILQATELNFVQPLEEQIIQEIFGEENDFVIARALQQEEDEEFAKYLQDEELAAHLQEQEQNSSNLHNNPSSNEGYSLIAKKISDYKDQLISMKEQKENSNKPENLEKDKSSSFKP